MKRIGGLRRKTRYRFRKHRRTKGKISLRRYLQTFNIGDRVYLGIEPAIQKGIYHQRFTDKVGTISGKRGICYKVSINDGRKEKHLIVHPIHLKKA